MQMYEDLNSLLNAFLKILVTLHFSAGFCGGLL